MTTNISIRISDATTRTRTRSRIARRHVAIPHTDLWTNEWWQAQIDPSASVRHLILEDLRVHGVRDVLNPYVAPFLAPITSAHLASPFVGPPAPAAAQPVSPAAAPAAASQSAPDVNALRDEVAALSDLVTTFMGSLPGASGLVQEKVA